MSRPANIDGARPAAAAVAAPPLQRLRAQAGMELRLLLRNGENLLVALGIPVGIILFFSLVPVVDFDEPAVDFLLPGVLAVAVMGSAMVSLGISTGFERSYLVLKRLGATPLRRGELVAAKILAVLGVQLVQVLVLLGAALALGWPVDGPSAGTAPFRWLLVAVALATGTAAFAGIGLAMAGRLRATATLALVNAVFLVLLLASGVVFPRGSLPGAMTAVTAILPSTALADVLRAALEDGRLAGAAFAVLLGWATAMCALAARVFRWE
jgi:ABC-2 type transport system permease protein